LTAGTHPPAWSRSFFSITYPVISEPPLSFGGLQEIVTELLSISSNSIGPVGGPGTSRILKKNPPLSFPDSFTSLIMMSPVSDRLQLTIWKVVIGAMAETVILSSLTNGDPSTYQSTLGSGDPMYSTSIVKLFPAFTLTSFRGVRILGARYLGLA